MIYLDSTIPLYATLDDGAKGLWCRTILTSVRDGRVEAATSALTLDEVQYRVRKERSLEDSLELADSLLSMPGLTILPVDRAVLREGMRVSREFRLQPRDSIHAAAALLKSIEEIYSEDRDFDRVEGLRRVWKRRRR